MGASVFFIITSALSVSIRSISAMLFTTLLGWQIHYPEDKT